MAATRPLSRKFPSVRALTALATHSLTRVRSRLTRGPQARVISGTYDLTYAPTAVPPGGVPRNSAAKLRSAIVVGTSRLQGDKALIALLTAVATTKPATTR